MTASLILGINHRLIFTENDIISNFLNIFWEDFVRLFSDDLMLRFLALFSDDLFILVFDDFLSFLTHEGFEAARTIAVGAFSVSIVICSVIFLLFICHTLLWWKYSFDD